MIIDLIALGGRSKPVEISIDDAEFDLELEHVRLKGPVQFSGQVSGDNVRAKLSGNIATDLEIECTRCLDPVPFSLPIEFTADFVTKEHFGSAGEHEVDPQNLSADSLDGERLDLVGIIKEQILLNLPEQVFCREDCKGLCERCGGNLNLKDCECSAEDIDPRWAALRNLK